uniref:Small integral membrane protein 29 n=1 Tax=Bursaphelenchus xylophilus TaxID=6326 RepID=A0A1I7RSK1_BURXY
MHGSPEPDISVKTYQVMLITLSLLISLGSAVFIVWTFFVEKGLKSELKEGKRRIEDDMLTYPRCRTAVEEYGMEVVTPWKDYFTREQKAFRTDSE